MNFIAHYFLDHSNPESFFAIGAATPDLLSIYNPGLRVKNHHLKSQSLFFKPEHSIFHAGLKRHFQADAIFHSSEFFARETALISAAMHEKMEDANIPRKFFLAHILVELILDRVIMRDHPNIVMNYYHHFDTTSMKSVKETTEFVVGHDLPNYEHFLNKFKENRYLLHYLEWDHIIFVVKLILRRVGIENHQFTENPAFFDLLSTYEAGLMSRYPALFVEMRAIANAELRK